MNKDTVIEIAVQQAKDLRYFAEKLESHADKVRDGAETPETGENYIRGILKLLTDSLGRK
ncbi:hypothetical protein [Acidaminococcus massiliensis]|jgi:hypothetical protein|uniref:hypothetical protein n=1 Tax=Acidaminococcus massiliensis TaxID=1852375 RepID=UPI00205ABBB5|nr:hypothetical protein [Acidaminococcus massiliensis]DAR24894.1 MAG TPA: hypothetical protein [Caudoviricetes sp.]